MKKFAWILPILAGVLWATAGIFVRELDLLGFNNLTIAGTRALIASVMMLLVMLLADRKLLKIRIRDLWIFAVGGLVGILFLTVSYNYAISMLTLSLAAVLVNLSPIFVLILAAILFHEPLTGRKLVCLALALAGCVLSVGILEPGAGGNWNALGLLCGLLAAIVRAVYSLISRYAAERGYHPLTMTFYGIASIAVLTVPFCDWNTVAASAAQQPGRVWLLLIFQALCLSALPYFLYNAAVLYMDVGTAAILAAVEPVAAMVIGALAYAEEPTVLSLIGLVLTLAALVLLNWKGRQAE